jgi:hypothetical protein
MMKVTDVLSQQPFEVTFVQRDYVIQQIPTAGSDPSLGNTVLPGTTERSSRRLERQCNDSLAHLLAKLCIAVID